MPSRRGARRAAIRHPAVDGWKLSPHLISDGRPDCDPPDGGPPNGDPAECGHPNVAAGLIVGEDDQGRDIALQGTAVLIGVDDDYAVFLTAAHGIWDALQNAFMHPIFVRIRGGDIVGGEMAYGVIPYDVGVVRVDRGELEAIYGAGQLPAVAELAPRGYCSQPHLHVDLHQPGSLEQVGYGTDYVIPHGEANPAQFQRVVYEGYRRVGHPRFLACDAAAGVLFVSAVLADAQVPGDSGGPTLHDGKVIAVTSSSDPRTVRSWNTLVETNLEFICPYVPQKPACAAADP